VVVIGYTLTTVAVGNAPLGTDTASVDVPDVNVTVRRAPDATLAETGVPYEEAAIPEGGGVFVPGGVVPPPPEDATLAVTVSVDEVTVL
jgi:hypothetical protein